MAPNITTQYMPSFWYHHPTGANATVLGTVFQSRHTANYRPTLNDPVRKRRIILLKSWVVSCCNSVCAGVWVRTMRLTAWVGLARPKPGQPDRKHQVVISAATPRTIKTTPTSHRARAVDWQQRQRYSITARHAILPVAHISSLHHLRGGAVHCTVGHRRFSAKRSRQRVRYHWRRASLPREAVSTRAQIVTIARHLTTLFVLLFVVGRAENRWTPPVDESDRIVRAERGTAREGGRRLYRQDVP